MTNIQLFAFVILPLALAVLVGLLVFGVDYYGPASLGVISV